MRQMSARFQCFSGTASLLVLFWDLPPPFPGISIISVSISDPGVRLGGEELGGGGVYEEGQLLLFTAPLLIVHLAKYNWPNSPK